MPSVTCVTNPEKCHTLSDHAKNLLAVLTLASSAWTEGAWKNVGPPGWASLQKNLQV